MREIPVIRLLPDPIDNETTVGFKWADPEVGFRHRIGGEPSIAPSAWPDCPSCRQSMDFYGQLDSINDAIVLADAGMLLVFVCFDCGEAAALVASG